MAWLRVFFLSFLLVFSACSPSMFSGKNGDSRLEAQRGSREGKPSCPSLELAGDRLTTAEFRGLLQCFNSNGSIQPLADWIASSSDQSVAPLVDTLNRFLFAPGAPRDESRSILEQLNETGDLEPFLKKLFSVFEEGEAIARAASNLDTDHNAVIREKVRGLTAEQAYRAAHALDRMSKQPSYESLRAALIRFNPPSDVRKKLVQATSRITQAFEQDPSAQAIAAKMSPQELVVLFRQILGRDVAEFQSRFASAELVLRTLGADQARRLDDVLRLVSSLNGPVSCMNDGRRFDDAWKYINQEFAHQPGLELNEFVTHFAATTALVIRDFCSVPSGFYGAFPSFFDLATSNIGPPALEWVHRLREAGIAYDLSQFLARHRDDVVLLFSELNRAEVLAPAILAISSMNDADARDFLSVAREFVGGEVVLSEAEVEQATSFISALVQAGEPSKLSESLGAVQFIFKQGTQHPWFDGIRSAVLEVRWQDAPALFRSERAGAGIKFLWELSRDDRLSGLILDVFKLFRSSPETKFDLASRENWNTRADFHRKSLSDFSLQKFQLSQSDQDQACRRLRYDQKWETQFADYFLCLGRPSDLAEQYQGLADRGLFRPFIETFSKWPWNRDQFRVMLPGFRDFIESGDLGLLIEKGGAAFSAVSDPLIHSMARAIGQARAEGKSFLNRLALLTREAAFFRDLRLLLDGTSRTYPLPALAAFPDAQQVEKYLRAKECVVSESEIQNRIQEIRENWAQALPRRDPGEWRNFLSQLATPGGNRTVQGIVRAFSLGKGERANGEKRFTPSDLHQFLARSSQSAQPISVYDENLRTTRVGVFTGLERLEWLLRSADFKFFLPTNFAEKFMAEIAQAWGDEPREQWPASIRERFGSSQPKTLAEVVDELESMLKQYENLGGLPKIENCDHLADGLGIPKDPRHWFRAPVPNRIRARLFQIHQMLPLIREELEIQAGSRVAGMKIIREIAFQFWDAGTIPVLTQAGQLGVIHAVSRIFSERVFVAQHASAERGLTQLFRDPELGAALGGVIQFAARSPVLDHLLKSQISFDSVQVGLEALLLIAQHVPQGSMKLVSDRLTQSPDSEWVGFGKWIDQVKPLTRAELQPMFGELVSLSDRDDASRGSAFGRVIGGVWKTSADTRLVLEWAFALLGEVDQITAMPTLDSSDRQKLVRMLREFTGYLAEDDGSVRATSARNAREQWISDSLRGPSFDRLADWVCQNPRDAAATLRRLIMSFRSNEFQKFLMTAARQLPR